MRFLSASLGTKDGEEGRKEGREEGRKVGKRLSVHSVEVVGNARFRLDLTNLIAYRGEMKKKRRERGGREGRGIRNYES